MERADGYIIYECDGLALARLDEPYDQDSNDPLVAFPELVLLSKVNGRWVRVGTYDDD